MEPIPDEDTIVVDTSEMPPAGPNTFSTLPKIEASIPNLRFARTYGEQDIEFSIIVTKNDWREKYHSLAQKSDELKEVWRMTQIAIEEFKGNFKAREDEHFAVHQQLGRAYTEVNSMEAKIEKLLARANDEKTKKDAACAELDHCKHLLSQQDETITSLRHSAARLTTSSEKLRNDEERAQKDIDDFQGQYMQMDDYVAKARRAVKGFQEACGRFKAEVASLQEANVNLTTELNQKKAQLERSQTDLEDQREIVTDVRKRYREAKREAVEKSDDVRRDNVCLQELVGLLKCDNAAFGVAYSMRLHASTTQDLVSWPVSEEMAQRLEANESFRRLWQGVAMDSRAVCNNQPACSGDDLTGHFG